MFNILQVFIFYIFKNLFLRDLHIKISLIAFVIKLLIHPNKAIVYSECIKPLSI